MVLVGSRLVLAKEWPPSKSSKASADNLGGGPDGRCIPRSVGPCMMLVPRAPPLVAVDPVVGALNLFASEKSENNVDQYKANVIIDITDNITKFISFQLYSI